MGKPLLSAPKLFLGLGFVSRCIKMKFIGLIEQFRVHGMAVREIYRKFVGCISLSKCFNWDCLSKALKWRGGNYLPVSDTLSLTRAWSKRVCRILLKGNLITNISV